MEQKNPFQLNMVSVRLVKDAPLFSDHKIKKPEDAVELVGDMICQMDREVICIINLQTDGTPINCSIASIGTVNQALAEPRELFKASILSNAAQMIMIHNHPSGNLEPSKEDTILTDRMLKLTELLQIPLVDHLIVGRENEKYFSFREKEMLPRPAISYITKYKMLDFDNGSMVAEQGKAR